MMSPEDLVLVLAQPTGAGCAHERGMGAPHGHGHLHGRSGNFYGVGDDGVTDLVLSGPGCPAGFTLSFDSAGNAQCVAVAKPAGTGYPTLAQHGAVCPPGYVVVTDSNGDEVCVPAPGKRGMGAGIADAVYNALTPTTLIPGYGAYQAYQAYTAPALQSGVNTTDQVNWGTFSSAITSGQQAVAAGNLAAAHGFFNNAVAIYEISPYVQNRQGNFSGDGVGGDQLDFLLAGINALQGQDTTVQTTQGESTQADVQIQQDIANLPKQGANAAPQSVGGAFFGSLGQSASDEASQISSDVSKAGAAIGSIFSLGNLKSAGLGAGVGAAVGVGLGGLVAGSSGILPGALGGALLGAIGGYLLGQEQAAAGASA